jgi:predicted negative regulator of RcsB-dependent stress response
VYAIFCILFSFKEGTVSTTKLTRKEILAEDSVHKIIVQGIEFFSENLKKVAVLALILVLVVIGIFAGKQYLDRKQIQAQEQLAKGIAFFHASISPDATADPYSKGGFPAFKSDEAKFKAAAGEFSSIVSGYGYSQISVVARYYLGITQLKLGQTKEAVQNLEAVANNSKERTMRFLAKKILANHYAGTGNPMGARSLIEDMIKDQQCDLPKEDLAIQLSRILVAQGKRDEAVKVLRDASGGGPEFSVFKQQLTAELDKLKNAPTTGSRP